MNTKSPQWRGLYSLALLAAIFTAIYKAMDNITVHNYAVAPDGLTAAFAYLIVGSWTGVISGVVFALLFGQKLLDPEFKGITFRNPVMHRAAMIAGFISAGSTLFLLWGNQFGDPSVLIALGNTQILFVVGYDVLKGNVLLKQVRAPMFLVLIGSMMAAFSGSLYVTLAGFLFVVVLSNGLGTFSEVVEQQGARASDGVNFFIWRFAWLATCGTILAFVTSILRGKLPMLMEAMAHLARYELWIVVTMFFVFLGIGLRLVLKKKYAITVVLLIVSLQMILGYPITLIGNAIIPGLFGDIPTDPIVWVIRALGALLMIWGIIVLRKR